MGDPDQNPLSLNRMKMAHGKNMSPVGEPKPLSEMPGLRFLRQWRTAEVKPLQLLISEQNLTRRIKNFHEPFNQES